MRSSCACYPLVSGDSRPIGRCCQRKRPYETLRLNIPTHTVSKIWIAIDTGGTFTDLVLCELATGKYVYHKLPNAPKGAFVARIAGISCVSTEFAVSIPVFSAYPPSIT